MEETIARQRYTRGTGTPRNKRNNQRNGDLISVGFAAKLLIAIVLLSVVVLCKSTDTAVSNLVLDTAKVVATKNYNDNPYISKIMAMIGVSTQSQEVMDKIKDSEDNYTNTENNPVNPQKDVAPEQETTNLVDNISDNSKNNITDEAKDTAKTNDSLIMNDDEMKSIAGKYSLIMPVSGEVESTFGMRTYALSGTEKFHRGIDIKANMGTSIKASLAGTVSETGENEENGKYIIIEHADGLKTIYAHCSIISAKKGQNVNQGDVIARVGSDGKEGNAYLHFEVWQGLKIADPAKVFEYLNK